LTDPNGLLAAGGDLTTARLLAAYRRGIFPWYQQGQPILWWSPDPRAVLWPQEIHISRSLRRRLRSNRYQVSFDQNFDAVIRFCAATRADSGTWITADVICAYTELHRAGYAHSVEIWCDAELAGGLYGVELGAMFFGESMFSLRSDASKVALIKLARLAVQHDFALIDCQFSSPHLESLGSRVMSRREFLACIADYTARDPERRLAVEPRQDTAELSVG
jgi:leucyl/phenylalanyl-tRNA--protein transferase